MAAPSASVETLKQPQASRIGRLLLLGYLAFVVYASLYPIARFRAPERSPLTLLFEPSRISRSDALTNVLVYFPLGWLLALRLPGLGWLRAGLFGCALSLAIEYLQAYLPGRVPSLLDWTLNTAGALLGAAFASRRTHFPRMSLERVLPAGRRARLGLAVVGTWGAAQLFPFVPSADLGSLRAGLRPLWHVLRGQASFSLTQAAVYALASIALAPILAQCLRPGVRARLVVPLALMGVLLAKVPVVTRQLSLEALVGALADVEWHVRARAAWGLGLVGDERAVEPLVAALQSPHAELRKQAAWALGLRGDRRALRALTSALEDADEEVRSQAAWALGLVTGRGDARGRGEH